MEISEVFSELCFLEESGLERDRRKQTRRERGKRSAAMEAVAPAALEAQAPAFSIQPFLEFSEQLKSPLYLNKFELNMSSIMLFLNTVNDKKIMPASYFIDSQCKHDIPFCYLFSISWYKTLRYLFWRYIFWRYLLKDIFFFERCISKISFEIKEADF